MKRISNITKVYYDENAFIFRVFAAFLFIMIFIGLFSKTYSEEEWIVQYKNDAIKMSEKKDYKNAIESIKIYIDYCPKDQAAHCLCATWLYHSGKFDQAKAEAETALKLNKNDFKTYNLLGLILMKKNKTENALESFKMASSINPDFPDAHINLGGIYLKKNDLFNAKKEFRLAKKGSLSTEPESWKNIANLYIENGYLNEAIYTCREFLKEEPESAEFYALIGKAFSKKGDRQAEAAYKNAVLYDPKKTEYHEILGDIYAKSGKMKEAVGEYEKAVASGKASSMILYRLGYIYFRSGLVDKSIPLLEKSVKSKEDLINAHLALSSIYLIKKNYRECIEHCDCIIKYQPKNDTAYYNKACSLAMLGNDEEALSNLKMSIKLLADNKKLAENEKAFQSLKKFSEFKEIIK